ncbi:NADPH:quinone reductase [Mycolicibacterium rutilum]|uniref:NADPH:quinone reductase n=1 Tax=Mycolicibacterium rutilum TaxID=370526 RepID=A0A1H6IPF9_MYCRU|nr:NADP-dependent oxidoreductase [Mycolicibacterium rutilum]SEH48229.1 NADPH:quinone reductase [Mycolicibacterium rutilum]
MRRAAVLTDFGDSDMFAISDLPMPRLRHSDEVLVRVAATSVNPIEWKIRQGLGLPKWLWRRLIGSPMILGQDFAGVVLEAGPEAAGFKAGDAVMGVQPIAGSYTTHLTARTRGRRAAITHTPAGVSSGDAAVVPFAGLVAYAGLVVHGALREGNSRVLVVGASGGVGHLAVQIAANGLGAEVIGVSSSRNEAFVTGLGARTVAPYDRIAKSEYPQHFPGWEHSFDLILDCVGDDSYYTESAPWLLKDSGRYVTIALPSFQPGRPGEDVGPRDGAVLVAQLARRYATKRYRLVPGLVGLPAREGLPKLARWLAEGKVVPRVASMYRLDEIAAAHRESEAGRTVGKIAVHMPDSP